MDDEDHQNNSPVPTRRDLESEDSEDEDPESEELEDEDLKGEDSKDEESEYENSEYEDSEDGDSEYEGLNLGFGDLDLEDESSVDEDPDDEDSEYEDLEDEDSEDEDFPDLDSEDLDLEDEDLGNENPEDQDCENKNLDTDRLPCEFCEKWPNVLVHEATKSNDNEEAIILPYVAENWHGDPRLVFHGSCSTCADAIDEDDDELCDFCRHLRLRHLLLCNNHIFSYWTGMGACMGTVKEVYDRKYEEDCSMCGLITRVISYLEAQDMAVEDARKADQQPSILGKKVDWNQVKSWLEECRRAHRPCNSDITGFWDRRFRVIDVHKRMVTRLPSRRCKFVALSYVWGTGPENEKAQLTKESIKMFEKPGGLDDLPATIQDAMKVCVELGERFLWVDRLCIIQDSDSDKLHQLKLMGQIYSSADFVIVAACVNGAKDGLRGVSRPRAQSQFQARVLEFEVTRLLPELEKALRRSKWGSRGWTYQEAILAKKKLYFTPSEVWFVCQDGGHREDQYGTEERLKPGSTELHSTLRLGSGFGSYVSLASQYASRAFTNQSDIYNAFGGIQNMLYPDTRVIYGLPERDFDEALLWSVPDDSVRPILRRAQGAILPSWSWTSIKSQIEYGDENLGSPWFPLVRWAFSDEGTIRSINSVYYEYWPDEYARTFLAIAWTAGCIEAECPFQFGEMDEYWEDEIPFTVSRKDLEKRWPKPHHFFEEVSLSPASSGHYDESRVWKIASHDDDIMKNLQHPGVIFTRAQTAHFNVGITPWEREWSIDDAGTLLNFKEFKLPLRIVLNSNRHLF
ncbi:Heterokaryon incompatibility protein [Lasiodiplodia theobromae]|uniref:Heterokaryon incompatibility protein n=1 Tax=Lasiodiplodia theobromae TaxID=45133 RepID=UPI0015C403D9|nr:Heterokaryon incompatibility protein [Lasiodiplodia theobromae]KAF4539076.1 Heterokaryon incompatibility protein [Lasiodiplodia theobromae]